MPYQIHLNILLVIVALCFVQETSFSQTNLDSLFDHDNYYFQDNGITKRVPYRYYIPTEGSRPYPITLYLHGSGNRGNDVINSVPRGINPLFNKIIRLDDSIPSAFIIPQLDVGLSWHDNNFEYLVLPIIDSLILEGIIDSNRIYVVGHSRGSGGLIDAFNAFPDKFAGGIPNAGAWPDQGNGYFSKPNLWLFQGEDDRADYVETCKNMAANSYSENGEMMLSLVNSGHGIESVIFEDSLTAQAIIYWLYSQHKQNAHTSVQWLQGTDDYTPIKPSTFITGENITLTGSIKDSLTSDGAFCIYNLTDTSLNESLTNNNGLQFCINELEGDTAQITSVVFQVSKSLNDTHVVLHESGVVLNDYLIDSEKSDSYYYSQKENLLVLPNQQKCFNLSFYHETLFPTNSLKFRHVGVSAIKNEGSTTVNVTNQNEQQEKIINAYPLPAKHINIAVEHYPFDYELYSNSGLLVSKGTSNHAILKLAKSPGVYMIKVVDALGNADSEVLLFSY